MLWWDLDWKIKPVVTVKSEIEFGDESKSLAQSEDSDCQISEARIRKNDYLIQHYLASFKHSFEILLE